MRTYLLPDRLRAEALVWRVRRMTAVPVLLRLLAGGAAFAALLVALPADVLTASAPPRLVPAVVLPAAIVAAAPSSRWVTVVMLGCVAAWTVAAVAYGDEATLPRIGLLAALIYVLHVSAAFAAVVPLDCVVAKGVVARWARRQGKVLATGLAVGLGGLALARLLPATPTLVGPVLGAVVAAGTAGVLAWLLRRR